MKAIAKKMARRIQGFNMRLDLPPAENLDLFNEGQSSGSNRHELDCCLILNPQGSLDNFEALDELGTGTSGTVYLVKHRCDGQRYAMKVIFGTDELMCKLKRELQIMRKSDCPHLIQLYGETCRDGELRLFLEYVDGGSLSSVLNQTGPLPERLISIIAKQALQGLEYLHRNRIMHRDIKPANLLVSLEGEVKIADFGSGRIMDDSLQTAETFAGTSAYMSPTRITGACSHFRSDVWALGLTLMECTLGHHPYPDINRNRLDFVNAVVREDAPTLPEDARGPHGPYSPEFRGFIHDCLQKRREDRPSVRDLSEHPFLRIYPEQQCKQEMVAWLRERLHR